MAELRKLPEPVDYFAGVGGKPWCWPVNVLIFQRCSRRDLQRRTVESRLHGRHVLVVNLMTSGVLNLDGLSFPLRPGQAHLIFPYQFHTYHDLERDELCWLFVTFEMKENSALGVMWGSSVTLDESMQETLGQLVGKYVEASDESGLQRMQMQLAELLLVLADASAQARSRPRVRTTGAAANLLAGIHSLLAHESGKRLTISGIAEQMSLSEGRLRAVFREAFGVSLGEYLRSYRLQAAAAMIRHSDARLTDIALAGGFGSSAAFCRAFKHWSGMRPGAYRRRAAGATPKNPDDL